jgi:hypothetical protein
MKRVLVVGVAISLGVCPVFAASPKIDAAVKTFKAVSADKEKLKIYCEMTKFMDSMGEKEDAAADAKVRGYMKQLGAEFEAAWNAGQNVEENSPDDKALSEALDDLSSKCT